MTIHSPDFFRNLIEENLKELPVDQHPSELYDPIRYMLSLGGKRLRPVLLLMANDLFGGDFKKAIGPAAGIEVFHNFTLLHDDIMDKAPIRRSSPTVHTRWNTDIAILSGDAMFVKSCQLMMNCEEKYSSRAMSVFLNAAIEVCEGQQLDMNFESKQDVTIPDYINMIRLKTGVLLGCSLYIGSLLAGADEKECNLMSEFGTHLGIAFQLHDDYLDVFGNEKKFGKQIGGDIQANKKTFLLLTALQDAMENDKKEILQLMNDANSDVEVKVASVKTLYGKMEVKEKTEVEMNKYFNKALEFFRQVNFDDPRKSMLIELAKKLMNRES